jgi:NTP pyrophosphatase (non-canonical NTP hydrolase)
VTRAERIHTNARAKGFYDEIDELMSHPNLTDKQKYFIHNLWLSNRLMLIVSELAEGLEGIRKGNFKSTPNSGGLGEELADTQIRLEDLAWSVGLNLDSVVELKMDYNAKREYRHGNRNL